MKLRAPAVPIITVDPYFSVWASDTRLNAAPLMHWTGKSNSIIGLAIVDGKEYLFLGHSHEYYKLDQVSLDITALSTKAVFEGAGIRLFLNLTTPALPDDYELLTRPVSYMSITYESIDGNTHSVNAKVIACEDLCLNHAEQNSVICEEISEGSVRGLKMGNTEQKPLNKSGDDVRIDWGYFCLAVADENATVEKKKWWDRTQRLIVSAQMRDGEELLYLFAYDDIESIEYFGAHLRSYWNRNGKTIQTAICEAAADYKDTMVRCEEFSSSLYADALSAGGEKYAEMLSLAYRQIIAGHKLVLDENGEILYISKECSSNGCAATVDVSYPSIPLFLLYNPELIKGMMRPIYRYADSAHWKDELKYDFAPHDVGQYPLLNGQIYGVEVNFAIERQMPVEECGNMIIMEANVALATGDASFAYSHLDTLKTWCNYLIKYGTDPEHQLCTDDFAGHLAHNCNLSVKAIMGIAGMSLILDLLGNKNESAQYMRRARKMAKIWMNTAINSDGSSKLAFDREGTWSMKYNMIWDKVWGTKLFSQQFMDRELKHNRTHFNKYGMPLDSRSEYTKSDWLVWTASMASSKKSFMSYVAPLWNAYNDSPSRIPMTDWYDTKSSYQAAFQYGFKHRTVLGGLYMKVLLEKNILKK